MDSESALAAASTPAPSPNTERETTDTSLREERDVADQVLADRRSEIEHQTDAQIGVARDLADDVLQRARVRTDQELDASVPDGTVRSAIDRERVREDEVLRTERDAADQVLNDERREHLILADLLPLERETTDRSLLIERARSDEKISNRDDFLGMVCHDLRNLLFGVLFENRELALNASTSPEGQRTTAVMMRQERYIARMNGLIGDLVDVVSIDAGRLAMHVERNDAARLLGEVASAFSSSAAQRGIALESDPPDRELPASFDHDRMLQVLSNLVGNAIKFTPRGGKIVLRAERSSEGVRLSVSDDGPGIPAQALEAVFERFWQAGEGERRGLGLGLYISRRIVEAHGGKIWAESALGEGSTFLCTLPGVSALAA